MMDSIKKPTWIVGVTGASGIIYALRLLDILEEVCEEVHVVFSEAAFQVLREEEGKKLKPSRLESEVLIGRPSTKLFFYDNKDIGAAIASGSCLTDGMVIVPLSMGTLGAVANGLSHNLIHRAADVVLKEGRQLVMVPRETPLSAIHLENMLKLARMQVRMVPAMPGFYQQPSSVADLVDMMVMKILDQMGIHRELVPRWGRDREEESEKVTISSQQLYQLPVRDNES